MRENKQLQIPRLTLFIYFILNIQLNVFNCQQNDETSQSQKPFQINNYYDLAQKQVGYTYELNLQADKKYNQQYLVIDINLSQIEFEQKLIVCLNFDYDILKDKSQINQQNYKCAFTDNIPRISQNQQYLLVIDVKNPNFQLQKTPYLTIISQTNTLGNVNFSQSLSQQLRYSIFMYYSNSKPCHRQCNGFHGVCNDKTGQCQCNKNYIDIDCSIEIKDLNLYDINDKNDIIIQGQKLNFYKVNLTQIMYYSKEYETQIQISKLRGNSDLNIQIHFNLDQQVYAENKNSTIIMNSDSIRLPNVKQLCQDYNSFNNIGNSQSNDQNSENPKSLDNCFAIISIKQSQSMESTFLRFTVKIEENKKSESQQNNNINLNDRTDGENEQTNSTEDDKRQVSILIISVFCSIGVLILFSLLYLRYRKSKRQQASPSQSNPPNQSQNNNIEVQVQVNNQLNDMIKVEQKKILFNTKRRFLQDKLMPIITHYPSQSIRNSIQNFDHDIQNNIECNEVKQIKQKPEQVNNNQITARTQLNDIKHTQHITQGYQDTETEFQQNEETTQRNNKNQQQADNAKENNDIEKCLQKYDISSMSICNQRNQQCCSICLTEFFNEEKVRKTICNHIFHIECLSSWLDKIDNCPLCRQSFEIIDMIDYLSQKMTNKKKDSEDKIKVVNELKKIKSIFEEKFNEIIQMKNEEFANIFQFFFPSNQELQNQQQHLQQISNQQQQNQKNQIKNNQNSIVQFQKSQITRSELLNPSCQFSSSITNLNNLQNCETNDIIPSLAFSSVVQSRRMTSDFSVSQCKLLKLPISQKLEQSLNSEQSNSIHLFDRLDHLQLDEIKENETFINKTEIQIQHNNQKANIPLKKVTQSLKEINNNNQLYQFEQNFQLNLSIQVE